ncbi:MAG: SRPBCC family protein [Planctomycetota bacterium]|nr:MAG: SRPBCC family protein [Planctomycetota bacterium]
MGCLNSIVVPAPVDAVWAKLRDFHDMSWAPGVIESCQKVGALGGTERGAKRILNGVFEETLLGVDDGKRALRYSIDRAPGTPVDGTTHYVGVIRVFPVTATNETFVIWTSSWAHSAEEGVAEFCNPIYKALLEALADSFSPEG